MIDVNRLKSAIAIRVSYRDPEYTAIDFNIFMHEHNMTRTHFANLMGVKVSKVDKWLAGKRKMTSTESILFSLFVENPLLMEKVIKVEKVPGDK